MPRNAGSADRRCEDRRLRRMGGSVSGSGACSSFIVVSKEKAARRGGLGRKKARAAEAGRAGSGSESGSESVYADNKKGGQQKGRRLWRQPTGKIGPNLLNRQLWECMPGLLYPPSSRRVGVGVVGTWVEAPLRLSPHVPLTFMHLSPARGRGWVRGLRTSLPPHLASPPSGGEELEGVRRTKLTGWAKPFSATCSSRVGTAASSAWTARGGGRCRDLGRSPPPPLRGTSPASGGGYRMLRRPERRRPQGGVVEGPLLWCREKEVLRLRFAPLRTTGYLQSPRSTERMG